MFVQHMEDDDNGSDTPRRDRRRRLAVTIGHRDGVREVHVVADDAGNAIATFNCGAGNDNVAHYSFTSDAWWGQQDIGVYGSGLSINPGGDAVATGTSIPDAQANIFR